MWFTGFHTTTGGLARLIDICLHRVGTPSTKLTGYLSDETGVYRRSANLLSSRPLQECTTQIFLRISPSREIEFDREYFKVTEVCNASFHASKFRIMNVYISIDLMSFDTEYYR